VLSIVTRRSAWLIRRLFGLDLLTSYTHTTREYGQYSAVAILHTVPHALGSSDFTGRILATDLWWSHSNFKSHMKSSFHSLIPFLRLFCICQFRRLDSIHLLCSQARILAGWRLETRLDYCSLLLLRVSKSNCDWWLVSQSVLVSSPI
jgi:hypothetical protein